MDEQMQLKDVVTFWDIVKWAMALLWVAVTVLARRAWNTQEQEVFDLKTAHQKHVDAFSQHILADTVAHSAIKDSVTEELTALRTTIDTKTDAIRDQIFEVLKLVGGKK